MGRLLTPLVAGGFGLLVGAYLSGLLIAQLSVVTPPGPWSDVVLVGFAGLTGLLFAVIGAWLEGAVDTNHLAVTPLRHLVVLTYTFLGAMIGAGVYLGLTKVAGPLPPLGAKVFAGFLIGLFALLGLDTGRRSARARIY